MRNNKGPKTDPCGTPNSTFRVSDFSSRHSVYCRRSERYDFMSLFVLPLIPYLSSFSTSELWSIVSNALLRSMKIPRTKFLLSV